jgi:hypothetical protein
VLRLDGALDGERARRWENPKRCPATAVQERRMRNLTRRRERLGIAQVPQLPKTFCGNEGVLECSGLTELWMARERVDGKNPKRCQATAFQETRIRSEFLENDHLRAFA